jgi:hypothetical protein
MTRSAVEHLVRKTKHTEKKTFAKQLASRNLERVGSEGKLAKSVYTLSMVRRNTHANTVVKGANSKLAKVLGSKPKGKRTYQAHKSINGVKNLAKGGIKKSLTPKRKEYGNFNANYSGFGWKQREKFELGKNKSNYKSKYNMFTPKTDTKSNSINQKLKRLRNRLNKSTKPKPVYKYRSK